MIHEEQIDGERLLSDVSSSRKALLTRGQTALLVSVSFAALAGFLIWKNPGGHKPEETVRPPANGIAQVVRYEPIKLAPMPSPGLRPGDDKAPPPPPPPPPTPRAPPTLPPPAPMQAAAGTAAPKGPGKMLSYATTVPDAASAASGKAGSREGTLVTYKGTPITGAKAGPAINKSLVLMPGIIRCVLDTAIDSTLPGPIMCHLPDPVISDGGVVLMEKGTQVIGSYTSEVHQGQGRLLAATATAYTPSGVPVPLGGPFADGLGRSGLDGHVDSHLVERFGGAVLLSLADSALSIAQASVSKGGNSYISLSQGGGVGSLAQDVLRSTISIPPTITKNQGEEVSLWILTPIDFSESYRLEKR